MDRLASEMPMCRKIRRRFEMSRSGDAQYLDLLNLELSNDRPGCRWAAPTGLSTTVAAQGFVLASQGDARRVSPRIRPDSSCWHVSCSKRDGGVFSEVYLWHCHLKLLPATSDLSTTLRSSCRSLELYAKRWALQWRGALGRKVQGGRALGACD